MREFVAQENKPKIIAEIGCNHKGDIQVAKEMIMTAAMFCKVDVVKFQKREPKELLTPAQYFAPHPNAAQAYGRSYGEHREFLEFSIEQHKLLKTWCDEFGVDYSTSVWDLTSARGIVSLNPKSIKIPSASNTNYSMIDYLLTCFEGEIHASLGMTLREEEDRLVEIFEKKNRCKDLVLYACTSGYPVAFEDVCLLEIDRLKKKFNKLVKAIGFSGHHLGIAVDVAAVTLGASWLERHFTLDRTWKGTDHAASLEPDGMRRLVRDIGNVYKALTYKNTEILCVENDQREKLKWKSDGALVNKLGSHAIVQKEIG